jgi:hypothetical protein
MVTITVSEAYISIIKTDEKQLKIYNYENIHKKN